MAEFANSLLPQLTQDAQNSASLTSRKMALLFDEL